MQSSDWIKQNPEMAIGAVFLVGSFLLGGGLDNLKTQQAFGNQLKADRTTQQQNLIQDQLTEDALSQRSELAKERLESDQCFQVVTADGQTQSVIQEGMAIVDFQSGLNLPDGVCVKDARFGITAVILNGVASDLAVFKGNENSEAEG